jgi:hypothetical protein
MVGITIVSLTVLFSGLTISMVPATGGTFNSSFNGSLNSSSSDAPLVQNSSSINNTNGNKQRKYLQIKCDKLLKEVLEWKHITFDYQLEPIFKSVSDLQTINQIVENYNKEQKSIKTLLTDLINTIDELNKQKDEEFKPLSSEIQHELKTLSFMSNEQLDSIGRESTFGVSTEVALDTTYSIYSKINDYPTLFRTRDLVSNILRIINQKSEFLERYLTVYRSMIESQNEETENGTKQEGHFVIHPIEGPKKSLQKTLLDSNGEIKNDKENLRLLQLQNNKLNPHLTEEEIKQKELMEQYMFQKEGLEKEEDLAKLSCGKIKERYDRVLEPLYSIKNLWDIIIDASHKIEQGKPLTDVQTDIIDQTYKKIKEIDNKRKNVVIHLKRGRLNLNYLIIELRNKFLYFKHMEIPFKIIEIENRCKKDQARAWGCYMEKKRIIYNFEDLKFEFKR